MVTDLEFWRLLFMVLLPIGIVFGAAGVFFVGSSNPYCHRHARQTFKVSKSWIVKLRSGSFFSPKEMLPRSCRTYVIPCNFLGIARFSEKKKAAIN